MVKGTKLYGEYDVDPRRTGRCRTCGHPIYPGGTYCDDCKHVHIQYRKKAKRQVARLLELARTVKGTEHANSKTA